MGMDMILRTVRDKYKKRGLFGLLLIVIWEVALDRLSGGINDMIDTLLITNIPKWIPDALRWILQDPFHIISTLGALIIIGIFIRAYLDTRLVRKITISCDKRSDGIFLDILNGTEYNLENAYLAVKEIEPEPEPARGKNGINFLKLLWGAPLPDPLSGTELFWVVDGNYQHRTDIESLRSVPSHAIKVESTGEAGFLVDKYSGRRLLTHSSQRPTRAIMYFDIGEITAKIQFGGTKPDGEVLTKIFGLELDYDGKKVGVKRIVQ